MINSFSNTDGGYNYFSKAFINDRRNFKVMIPVGKGVARDLYCNVAQSNSKSVF